MGKWKTKTSADSNGPYDSAGPSAPSEPPALMIFTALSILLQIYHGIIVWLNTKNN